MILDRVENDEYIIQNTLFSPDLASSQNLPLLKISRKKRYYAARYVIINFNNNQGDYICNRPNNEFIPLTSDGEPTMNKEEWYLLPQAYSIILTPE